MLSNSRIEIRHFIYNSVWVTYFYTSKTENRCFSWPVEFVPIDKKEKSTTDFIDAFNYCISFFLYSIVLSDDFIWLSMIKHLVSLWVWGYFCLTTYCHLEWLFEEAFYLTLVLSSFRAYTVVKSIGGLARWKLIVSAAYCSLILISEPGSVHAWLLMTGSCVNNASFSQ